MVRPLASVLPLLALVLLVAPPASATRTGRDLVAGDLAFPANIALAADGRIFFIEKDLGNVRIIADGHLLPEPFFHLDVLPGGETGLLGLALHPSFAEEPWVYLYYSDPTDERNHLIRVLADGNRGTDVQSLIDGLTTTSGYHNGGDIAFGLDGTLFLSLGEAHEADRAQDPNDIGGKVVRIEADGNLPEDNPFGPDSPVYSIGHRNSFGLCVDPATGDLWETENGPGSDDEVNLVVAGENYGWPDQLGPGGEPRYVDPVVDYREIIVPTGCAVWEGELFFGSYGTGFLHRISLPAGPGIATDDVVARFDRGITDVAAGPDGHLYVATDDAIWRIRGEAASMSPVPVPSATARPTGTGSVDEGGGSTVRRLATAAAIVAAVGLALRFAAGRRSGHDPEPPRDGPSS